MMPKEWYKYVLGTGLGAIGGAVVAGKENRIEGAVVGGGVGFALGHLYALTQQVTPPEGAEGEYNSYVLKWKREINDIYLFYFSYFLPGEKKLICIVYTDILLIDVETGAIEVYQDYASTATVYAQTQDRSRFDRYSAMMRSDWMHIDIWKDDKIIQTFEVEDPATYDWFSGVVVSPSGRWILTLEVDESESPDKYFLRLYEGSPVPLVMPTRIEVPVRLPVRPLFYSGIGVKQGFFRVSRTGMTVKVVPMR